MHPPEHAEQGSNQAVDSHVVDSYLSAIFYVCNHYNISISPTQLSDGLATNEGQLTLASIETCAKRARLQCQFATFSIRKLPRQLLPIIVVDDNNVALVVTSLDLATNKITVVIAGQQEQSFELDQLPFSLSGQVILLKPELAFDARTENVLADPDQHWFMAALVKNRTIYRDVFIASCLINLFALASPLFVMNVYDKVVPNLAMDSLWVLTAGISLVFLFDLMLRQLRSYFVDVAGKKIDLELASLIYSRVLGIKHQQRPDSVGAFVNQIQSFESVRDFVTSATLTTLIDIPFAVMFLAIIWLIGGPVVYVPLAIIGVLSIYAWWLQKPLLQAIRQSSMLAGKKQALLVESLVGLEHIKLAGANSHYQSQYEQTVAYISYWDVKMRKLMSSVSSLAAYLQQMAVVLVVVAGVYLVSQGVLTMGGIIAGVMLTSRAINPFSQLSILSTRYNQAKAALLLLESVVSAEQEQDFTQPKINPQHWLGKIQLVDVSFNYKDSDITRLSKLNLTIQPGEKVGIIGRVGAGKTTLHHLLASLYQPSSGTLLIDNFHSQQLELSAIRRQFGCVNQDNFLIFGTIRDNITLGVAQVDEVLLQRAVQMSGVASFTQDQPNGLERQVGERGQFLSGGQRQAIVIARALLLAPKVLLLDEPTSAMDNRSELDLINQLKQLPAETTLIITTHKNSMLALVDRLIVLENGVIVADGPKTQVLTALNGGTIKVAETADA